MDHYFTILMESIVQLLELSTVQQHRKYTILISLQWNLLPTYIFCIKKIKLIYYCEWDFIYQLIEIDASRTLSKTITSCL